MLTSWYFSYNYQKECHIYECIIMIYVVGLENLFSKGFQKVSPLVELNKQGYVQGELKGVRGNFYTISSKGCYVNV